VLLEARNKYDGTRRSPWNEVECGDHYTRPMAGFLLFEIASGQVVQDYHQHSLCQIRYHVTFYSNGMHACNPYNLLPD